MTNLDNILKIRDITLLTKVHRVKAIVLPVAMYGCESWTIKKAEHWRIGAFELWCWRRLLRVPWAARRSNQSILKEITPEYSLEGQFQANSISLGQVSFLSPLPYTYPISTSHLWSTRTPRNTNASLLPSLSLNFLFFHLVKSQILWWIYELLC